MDRPEESVDLIAAIEQLTVVVSSLHALVSSILFLIAVRLGWLFIARMSGRRAGVLGT